MSNTYKTTQTRMDFTWPRLVPLLAKPSKPPLRTGTRIYCPEPITKVCKEDNTCCYDFINQQSTRKKIPTDDDQILTSRRKVMLLNEQEIERYYICDKMKSTYQIDFANDQLSFDDLMNNEKSVAKKTSRKKGLRVDPLRFKKIMDKVTIFDKKKI